MDIITSKDILLTFVGAGVGAFLSYYYSEIKLNLTGKYTNVIKDAKLYATFILFNLQ